MKTPDPSALVLFGATGDLAQRKLVPALYQLAKDRLLPEATPILGMGRSAHSVDELRGEWRKALGRFARSQPIDERVWAQLAARIDYVRGGFDDGATYALLRDKLSAVEARLPTRGNRLFYLATLPSMFETILAQLREAGLVRRAQPPAPSCRVVMEKPFGLSLAGACRINRLAAEMLDEPQLYRVDHYLAKETVQNILVLRFGNSVFEPLWNRKHVDHVEITAAETLGVEGRGAFYDETGVLVDVVQNHLLQVLSLCAAEAPLSFGADDIQDRKLDVLRAVRPLSPADVVAGQYRGYLDEPGVQPGSRTPTFVALKLYIDNWRWRGVPFYLRAGKRLRASLTTIDVQAQPIPMCLFESEQCSAVSPNVLTLRVQPKDGIGVRFVSKVPADRMQVAEAEMSFSTAQSFGDATRDAYERIFLDALRGDPTLFARRDLVERSWELVTPLLEAWKKDPKPVPLYDPGSDGPAEAHELILRDGRTWRRLA